MALEATFEELLIRFQRLHETVAGLRLTVVEDRPLRNEVLIVDRLGDAVEDLVGLIQEGAASVKESLTAVKNPIDTYRAHRALAAAHETFNRLEYSFFDLMSYERIYELTRFGRQRGREWFAWTNSVKEALDQCRQPTQQTGRALLACWQELAERLGTTSVSVQATNIGQQISTGVTEDVASDREEIT